ncbi:MAG: GspE/PulE family protein [Acidobacteriota bacterium]
MPESRPATTSVDDTPDLESFFVSSGFITEAQIERARRIARRLDKPRTIGEILVDLGQLPRAAHDHLVQQFRSRLTLAQILQEAGALSPEGAATFAENRRHFPRKTERQLLVESGLVTETAFLPALAAKYDIPTVEPEVALVDTKLLDKASIPYLRRNAILPFRVTDDTLDVIFADPGNRDLIAEMERIFGLPIRPCAAPAEKILEALSTIEQWRITGRPQAKTSLQYREIEDISEDDPSGEGAVRVVDYLLFRAIGNGASDLHIEPRQTKVHVRIRVDGVLQSLTDLPIQFGPRLAARIKVLAGADIAEKRLHQDGRIFVKVEGREVDIRVSTYASMFGETIVLRILDRKHGLLPLESLGFEEKILSALRDVVLRASTGLTLVTGPTGSGKTTTLYSFVDFVNGESQKVITCEDPVEYVLAGVTQCSVNEKTGPTFADSLRAILRQDPDTIVVGEIRDGETAGLAVEAALTGHKVFSTFHTEDSVGAVIRLLEMGVEPFLVASTLAAIVAQRLVRRLCKDCRRTGDARRRDLLFLGMTPRQLAGLSVLEAVGCDNCGQSGFAGRVAIHEVLIPDDDFRDAVLRHAPSRELRSLAKKLPQFLTLQEDGLLKTVAGSTTLSELADNSPRDTAARDLAALRNIACTRRFT